MNKLLVGLGLALLIAGICLVTVGSALSPAIPRGFNATEGGYDSFQYKNNDELTQHWVVTKNGAGAYVTISENYPTGYTYNKFCNLGVFPGAWGAQYAQIKNKNCSSSNYWAFNVLYAYYVYHAKIYIYDDTDTLIHTLLIYDYLSDSGAIGLWEIVRINSTNDVYVFVDGQNIKGGGGPITTSTKPIGYLKFYTWKDTYISDPGGILYLDDFSNYKDGYGGCVGLGTSGYDYIMHEEDPDDISFSFTLQHYPDSTFYDYTYKIKVMDYATGQIFSTDPFTVDHGNVAFHRSSLLGYNYGIYKFMTTKDDATLHYEVLTYIPPGEEGNLVGFTDDQIVIGEEATVTWTLINYNAALYDYEIRIKPIEETAAIVKTFVLDASSGSVDWNTIDETQGFYVAFLARITKLNPSADFDLAYGYTNLVEKIKISGYAYNMLTGGLMSGVDVVYKQGATTYSDTTNVSGYYMVEDLMPNVYTLVNATKANYVHHNWTLIPPSGFHTVDLYLYPSNMGPYPKIGGQVLSYPYYQVVEGATVSITNYTWSDTNTTTAFGYYEFNSGDGLNASCEYMLNVSATGYFTSNDTNVTAAAASFTELYFVLEPSLTLTLRARDRDTGGYLSVFNATINSTVYSTTDGVLVISSLGYQWYEDIPIQAPDYQMALLTILMYEDKEETVELSRVPAASVAGIGMYMPPHNVHFTVQDIFFRKKEDVSVTVAVLDTTMADWNWLHSIYGYDEDTYTQNTTMSDITDSMGGVTFLMVPAIRYKIKFVNDALGIDKTMNIYPHKNDYTVIVSSGLFGGLSNLLSEQPSIIGDEVIVTFSQNKITEQKCYLNITYNDTTLNTNSIFFYVNDSSNTVLNSVTKNLDYYEYSYLLNNISGNTFLYGLVVDHKEYGVLREGKVVHFAKRILVIDGWTEGYYFWSSFAFIFTIGALFTGITVKYAAVIVPIFSWLFWYMGWLIFTYDTIILMIITAIGIAFYITDKGRKEHMT